MIRFLLIILFLVSFLVFSIPVLIVEWLIGRFNIPLKNRSSLAVVKWGFRQIIRICGAKVIALGEDNIPRDTAVLYVANHRSYFDIILTYVRVPGLTGFVSKKEMRRYPLLSNWMRNVNCLFLDRENIKEGFKTILSAIEKVKMGISIFIFPEGTRNKVNDTFLPFHEGSFKIAEKGNVPIVPVTIVNSAALFEDHLPLVKKATVVIEYGEPIYIHTLEKEQRKSLSTYVSGIIADTYFKNRKQYFGQ